MTSPSVVAFVASTLPAAHIRPLLKNGESVRVICRTTDLQKSYQLISNGSQTSVEALPNSKALAFLNIASLMLRLKLNKQELRIYHECCWLELDLLIWLFRPNGVFHPIVSIDSFERFETWMRPIKSRNISFRLKRFLVAGLLSRVVQVSLWAVQFRGSWVVVPKADSYPKGIKILRCPSSTELETIPSHSASCASLGLPPRFVLILTGLDFADEEECVEVVRRVAEISHRYSVEVVIKDHPNANFRLKCSIDGCFEIDPLIPIEALGLEPVAVFGIFSSALLRFKCPRISLSELFETGDPAEIRERKLFLANSAPEYPVMYPSSWGGVDSFFSGLK